MESRKIAQLFNTQAKKGGDREWRIELHEWNFPLNPYLRLLAGEFRYQAPGKGWVVCYLTSEPLNPDYSAHFQSFLFRAFDEWVIATQQQEDEEEAEVREKILEAMGKTYWHTDTLPEFILSAE